MTPANHPEEEATPLLKADLDSQHAKLGQLYIDLFKKTDFKLDMRSHTITRPAGTEGVF